MKKHSKISGDMLFASGLPIQKARVWSALTEYGPLNMTSLATFVGLTRPALYRHLPFLLERGLIQTEKKGKRTLYDSTGAEKLKAWRIENGKAFENELTKLKRKDSMNRGTVPSDDFKIYRGKEELRKVWREILSETPRKALFYRYDGYALKHGVSQYLPPEWYEVISKKNIERYVITNHGLRHSPYMKKIECESRMLPRSFDAFEQGISQFIFSDRLILIDFTTATAFLIRNKALAHYHKTLFRFLLKTLKD